MHRILGKCQFSLEYSKFLKETYGSSAFREKSSVDVLVERKLKMNRMHERDGFIHKKDTTVKLKSFSIKLTELIVHSLFIISRSIRIVHKQHYPFI